MRIASGLSWRTWPCVTLVICWLALLAAIVALPHLFDAPNLGDDLTRYTVRLALICYAVSLNLMLFLEPPDWSALSPRGCFARCCWTLACITYLVHLDMAFHYYHGWSHARAIQHTQEVSGFGNGIYFSHAFTIDWCADVLLWWVRPIGYAARSRWQSCCLHFFMLFIIFNATVVYEEGAIRWAGILMFLELAGAFLLCRFLLDKSPKLG